MAACLIDLSSDLQVYGEKLFRFNPVFARTPVCDRKIYNEEIGRPGTKRVCVCVCVCVCFAHIHYSGWTLVDDRRKTYRSSGARY